MWFYVIDQDKDEMEENFSVTINIWIEEDAFLLRPFITIPL